MSIQPVPFRVPDDLVLRNIYETLRLTSMDSYPTRVELLFPAKTRRSFIRLLGLSRRLVTYR